MRASGLPLRPRRPTSRELFTSTASTCSRPPDRACSSISSSPCRTSRPVRFLLLASVHLPLRQLASQGQFLPDLAFRLSAVRFSIPPLRDHREDIAPIVQALLDRICTRYRQPAAVLASGSLPRLLQHSWPGNVRELACTLESAILESKTGVIRPHDLVLDPPPSPLALAPPAYASSAYPNPAYPNPAFSNSAFPSSPSSAFPLSTHSAQRGLPLTELTAQELTLNAAIHRHIQYVLELNRGNKLRTARQLDISRSTLYRILAGEALASVPSSSVPSSSVLDQTNLDEATTSEPDPA